jgi:hypothetical protein
MFNIDKNILMEGEIKLAFKERREEERFKNVTPN